MMKLEQYISIDKLNHALLQMSKDPNITIQKVKLLTVNDEPRYYILYEYETNNYQSKSE